MRKKGEILTFSGILGRNKFFYLETRSEWEHVHARNMSGYFPA